LSDATASDDATVWHRRFAAASNNRAWDLSVQGRTKAEHQEMLSAAHTSAWHWSRVGSELNRMRATMLLSEVHSLLGYGPSALAYAEEMRDYFLRVGAPDWETAFVHVVHAHAASAAGDKVKHRASYESAVAALANISNEAERRNVASTFSHVPKP
jgi:hypothetical protein